jgi:hypothetical protein
MSPPVAALRDAATDGVVIGGRDRAVGPHRDVERRRRRARTRTRTRRQQPARQAAKAPTRAASAANAAAGALLRAAAPTPILLPRWRRNRWRLPCRVLLLSEHLRRHENHLSPEPEQSVPLTQRPRTSGTGLIAAAVNARERKRRGHAAAPSFPRTNYAWELSICRAASARCPSRQDLVAHSWPKRRSDDWLNHADRSQPPNEKRLQMRTFGAVRRRASFCRTRRVTPEVAGSSPVALRRKARQDDLLQKSVTCSEPSATPRSSA